MKWQPMVRPPRLGGNTPMGVFATRSPYRPNPIGLSSVRLCRIDYDSAEAPTLIVAGADLMDGTPLYDIKPYLAYTDSHADALGGFAQEALDYRLHVHCPPSLLDNLPESKRKSLLSVLAEDPRPSYQHDPKRLYGLYFAGFNIEFTVDGNDLYVTGMQERQN
jgi:tRNA (adenine37-N6)-methyltransferase